MTSNDRDRVLARWNRSGLSAHAFAPTVGVSPWTLYSWRRKARGGRSGGLAPAGRTGPGFVELSAELLAGGHDRRGPQLTIELPRGVTLRVGRDFDPAALRRVIDALLA